MPSSQVLLNAPSRTGGEGDPIGQMMHRPLDLFSSLCSCSACGLISSLLITLLLKQYNIKNAFMLSRKNSSRTLGNKIAAIKYMYTEKKKSAERQ